MGWVSAATSVVAAKQASANGKFNQQVFNRNAEVQEQQIEVIESKKELDLARFDQQFQVLEGEVITKISSSGAELSGSSMRVMSFNAEQAELEKDMISYNAEIGKSRAFEEANFSRIKGNQARSQARMQELGYYAAAGESLMKAYG